MRAVVRDAAISRSRVDDKRLDSGPIRAFECLRDAAAEASGDALFPLTALIAIEGSARELGAPNQNQRWQCNFYN